MTPSMTSEWAMARVPAFAPPARLRRERTVAQRLIDARRGLCYLPITPVGACPAGVLSVRAGAFSLLAEAAAEWRRQKSVQDAASAARKLLLARVAAERVPAGVAKCAAGGTALAVSVAGSTLDAAARFLL